MVTAGDEERLTRLSELIAQAPLNLVSRRDRNDVRALHVDEAVAVAAQLAAEDGSRWLDLGTGGGLPGLVLAVLRPSVHWVLVDATAKKVAAVRGFADALALENVDVLCGRAEELARQRGLRASFDGVVMRAVASLAVSAELARGFLTDGGAFVAVKGPRYVEDAAGIDQLLPRLRLEPPTAEEVPNTVRATWLVTMRARGQVPEDIPRANGLPQSEPLGGARS